MIENPLVSICIPTYNAVEFIEETINCFIKQTYKNWEIIIQDDCSNDGTWELLSKKYANNPRIKIYQNGKNLGIGKNWNEAYDKVTGEYVVIFNADDLIPNNFIETLLPPLEQDITLDFASCAFKYWILGNDNQYRFENTYNKMPEGKISNINALLLTSHPFSHVFTLHRRSSLNKVLLANHELFILHQVCDYELWMRMGIAGFRGYHTNLIFGKYRKHLSNNSYIHNAEFSGTAEVLKHHLPLKAQQHKIYKKWIYLNAYNHIKGCLRHGKVPHFKSVFLLIKYYFK
jgi:glycosyltransferase involved in cell wall biosynthesis